MNDFEYCAVRFRLSRQRACQRVGICAHWEHTGLRQGLFGAGQLQRKVVGLPGFERSFVLFQLISALADRVNPMIQVQNIFHLFANRVSGIRHQTPHALHGNLPACREQWLLKISVLFDDFQREIDAADFFLQPCRFVAALIGGDVLRPDFVRQLGALVCQLHHAEIHQTTHKLLFFVVKSNDTDSLHLNNCHLTSRSFLL